MASFEKPIDFAAFCFDIFRHWKVPVMRRRFGKDNAPMFEAPIPIGRPNDLSFLEGKPIRKTNAFSNFKTMVGIGF